MAPPQGSSQPASSIETDDGHEAILRALRDAQAKTAARRTQAKRATLKKAEALAKTYEESVRVEAKRLQDFLKQRAKEQARVERELLVEMEAIRERLAGLLRANDAGTQALCETTLASLEAMETNTSAILAQLDTQYSIESNASDQSIWEDDVDTGEEADEEVD
ncbi:hypothetical protein RQP46_009406 [Phenoliferia psychrophenolica]